MGCQCCYIVIKGSLHRCRGPHASCVAACLSTVSYQAHTDIVESGERENRIDEKSEGEGVRGGGRKGGRERKLTEAGGDQGAARRGRGAPPLVP